MFGVSWGCLVMSAGVWGQFGCLGMSEGVWDHLGVFGDE